VLGRRNQNPNAARKSHKRKTEPKNTKTKGRPGRKKGGLGHVNGSANVVKLEQAIRSIHMGERSS